jgi:hypothetical protein
LISKNQIEFATFGPKIGGEKFQTLPFQIALCGPLPELAVTQMDRQLFCAPPSA